MQVEKYVADLFSQGLSPREIAEKIPGWNHMKVRRLLSKMGIKQRDKSEAQKNGLRTGRCPHPNRKDPESHDVVYNTEDQTSNEESNDE